MYRAAKYQTCMCEISNEWDGGCRSCMRGHDVTIILSGFVVIQTQRMFIMRSCRITPPNVIVYVLHLRCISTLILPLMLLIYVV